MKTIPFDIKLRKLIQSEENNYQGRYKVQTGYGNSVRIICWDKKDSEFPIVALVMKSPITETCLLFSKEGKYYPTGGNSDYDLFLIDTWKPISEESEQIEFEKKLANYLYKSIEVVSMNGMETLAKEFAPKLLELAKKEVIKKLNED